MQLLKGDDAKGLVIQPFEQRVKLVGKFRCIVGCGLAAQEPGQTVVKRSGILSQTRLTQDSPAAPLLSCLMSHHADGLPNRDREEHTPEIVTIGQVRELTLASALAEALEGAQCDIFLVDGTPGAAGEPSARQPNKTLEVSIPKLPDVITVACFKALQSVHDGLVVRHREFLGGPLVMR